MSTIQASDPRFETEGLRHLTVKSAALGGRGDITLFVPPYVVGQPLPAAILLHGVYSSHWAWTLRGGVHRTAARLIREGRIRPMVLAMPSDGLWGDGSGYVPHAARDFEQWILEDVRAAVFETVEGVTPDSPWCIGGLSMGGFGALRMSAKYPGRFAAACGLSSITHWDQMTGFVEEDIARCGVAPQDRTVLEAMLRNKGRLPAIRFECGTEDPLLEANRRLHIDLEGAGIVHEYEESPGGHDWAYWSERVVGALEQFDRAAGRRPR